MDKFENRYLEFCKQFVESVKDVFSTMLMVELNHGQPQIQSKNSTIGDITGIMGMNGVYKGTDDSHNIDFKGSFFISWPTSTYLGAAGAMLGETYTEITDEIEDVGLEICNIAMGGAKQKLNPMGYKIEMAIPNMVSGTGHEIKADKDAITIVVPMKSELGEFFLGLNYKESKNS